MNFFIVLALMLALTLGARHLMVRSYSGVTGLPAPMPLAQYPTVPCTSRGLPLAFVCPSFDVALNGGR